MKETIVNATELNTTEFEQTLKLVAELPAPERLAERVKAELSAPARGRLLAWPVQGSQRTLWLRAAIAAGLLVAVAAGGVTAYRWVAPASTAHSAPARPAAQQNFSTAGAMRTPHTVNGPAALPEAHARPQEKKPAAR